MEPAGLVSVFAKRFPQLSAPILIRAVRAWYGKSEALHGASFGAFQCSISLKLSKWH
jgi:hypothetical protein